MWYGKKKIKTKYNFQLNLNYFSLSLSDFSSKCVGFLEKYFRNVKKS